MIDFAPFVENDPRKDRTTITITNESLSNRCEVMLPPELIEGKKILDIGSALGAMGHWCLEHGAARYDGVEIQQGYRDLSRELLMRKYDNCAIWGYFDDIDGQYDIVIAAGVIHGVLDVASILSKICARSSKDVILETHLVDGIEPSIALIQQGNMINFSDINKPFAGFQMVPNRPAIDLLMKFNGFDLDTNLYPKPILGSHDAYNTKTGADRFIARYIKGEKVTTLEEAIHVGIQ